VSTGEEIRLARLFDGGGNAVVAAIDHGLYNGPRPGFEELSTIVDSLSGADAILISPGSAAHVASVFRRRGAPAMMVRLNWGTQYATQWDYRESRSVPMISAAGATALGADIVLVGMSIKTGSEAVDAENVAMVARCVAEKREAGVPIVGEVYPAGHEDISPEERHEVISIGCRIVAELGVDLVKTFYTGDRFSEIVRSTPVPILALGAKKLPSERDALALAARAVRSGARGVVFGRNLIQAADTEAFLQALCDVVKAGLDPIEAAKRYGIG
jgi:DhnA family fructose-bisphosphate aldolase class Ia